MSLSSLHCARCGVNWPRAAQFEQCPKCQVPTRPRLENPSLSLNEALFERVYAEHERERRKRGDLDPDTLGVLDARAELEAAK